MQDYSTNTNTYNTISDEEKRQILEWERRTIAEELRATWAKNNPGPFDGIQLWKKKDCYHVPKWASGTRYKTKG